MQQKLMKQYEYQLSKPLGFIILIMFGLMAKYGISKAIHNDNGMTIRHSIELSTEMATYFWWGSSIIFLALAILGLLIVIKSFQAPIIITLDDYQITAPKKPIYTKIITVKYREIEKCEVHKIANARQLRIDSPYGKVVIPDVNFVNKAEFNEMVQILSQKVKVKMK